MSVESSGKRVLLVDDDIGMLTLVAVTLQQAGHTVELAGDGQEAWNRFQKTPFDIVVLDRNMPLISGDELAQRVKSASPHLPIILITGFIQGIPHPEIFAAILDKPFHAKELLACIDRSFRVSGR